MLTELPRVFNVLPCSSVSFLLCCQVIQLSVRVSLIRYTSAVHKFPFYVCSALFVNVTLRGFIYFILYIYSSLFLRRGAQLCVNGRRRVEAHLFLRFRVF